MKYAKYVLEVAKLGIEYVYISGENVYKPHQSLDYKKRDTTADMCHGLQTRL